jgi:hypothetical protein
MSPHSVHLDGRSFMGKGLLIPIRLGTGATGSHPLVSGGKYFHTVTSDRSSGGRLAERDSNRYYLDL